MIDTCLGREVFGRKMNLKNKKIFWLILSSGFLVLILGSSFWKNVYSQEASLGLSLSPPTFELSANPGDSLINVIRVENLNNYPIEVMVERRNFTAAGEEGAINLTEEQTSFSLASWITVSPDKETIPAKSSQTFSFKTDVPLNAEPGGHFGSIVFKVGGKEKPTSSGAALAQELGSLVLLRVAGRAEEEGNLASFTTSKKFFEYGPVDFEIRVRNDGNVHLKPTGSVIINNFWGKQVATIEITSKNVLPGAIRKLDATWDRKLLLGRYRAIASLTYGTEGKILVSSTSFFGFPYKIGGLILLALIILSFFLYRGRKRIKLALKVLFGRYH